MLTRRIHRPLFAELDWLNREFGRMNQDLTQLFSSTHQSKTSLNWDVTEEATTVTAELPGINSDDLNIHLENRKLTISGERQAAEMPEESRYVRQERRFGRFSRTLTLPYAIDAEAVNADYSDGILTITLPRLEADKPRKIAVTATSKES